MVALAKRDQAPQGSLFRTSKYLFLVGLTYGSNNDFSN
jgi:hypothetical protein